MDMGAQGNSPNAVFGTEIGLNRQGGFDYDGRILEKIL